MKTVAGKILIVDDEPDLLTLYELALLREGLDVSTASTLAAARHALAENRYDLLVTDMRLPDGMGLDLVHQLTQEGRAERVVVITAYGSADNAVQALKAGAFDYLTKPVDLHRFRMVVRDAIQSSRQPRAERSPPTDHRLKSSALSGSELGAQALSKLVGDSAAMVAVRSRVRKVAASMAPVLLQGESGTGKELVARAIHECSHRGGQAFVAVNCGAIPETLLEAEFFGVKKGAYTGAQQDREGYFQVASGGTLFLDEIGDLPLIMQSKLLRAIQERCVRPIGGAAEVPVDVRIVSASHKRLADEVQAGRFRKDLYYRLNVIETWRNWPLY
jgi:two-component system, NtrC family, response regulator PilR